MALDYCLSLLMESCHDPGRHTDPTSAELVSRLVGAGHAVKPLPPELLPGPLDVLGGHVLVTHHRHLVGGDVAHHQVLAEAHIGPDVELSGSHLAPVLDACLLEPLKDGLLDGGPELLHINLGRVGDPGAGVKGGD